MNNHNFNHKFRFDFNKCSDPIKMNSGVLYQVGDILCEDDTLIDDHWQSCFELSFIDFGKGVFFTNNIALDVEAGDVYISIKGDKHRIEPSKTQGLRFLYIAFDFPKESFSHEIISYFEENFKDEKKRVMKVKDVLPFMHAILAEITNEKKYHLQQIELNIFQILISMYRKSIGELDKPAMYNAYTKKELVHSMARFIDNNIESLTNLKKLYVKFPFARSYLSTLFKTVTGKTLNGYYLEKRFEYALLLMKDKKLSITKTAETLNYSSVNNFSRAFKNYFGCSPKDYLVL